MGLDFISPLANGIAKYMLKKGLKSMMDPFTGNLAVRRGKRVFEITRERYPSPPANLLFLIYDSAYAVWRIARDEGGAVTLEPYNFKMSDYAEYFSIGSYTYPCTCKSNTDYTKHAYTIQPGITTSCTQLNYGKYNSVCTTLFGLRNSYLGDTFDTNTDYLAYSSSEYICSARNSTYYDETLSETVNSLELWKASSTTGTVKYKIGDIEYTGGTASFSSMYDVMAVLNVDGDIVAVLTRSNYNDSSAWNEILNYWHWTGAAYQLECVRIACSSGSSSTAAKKYMFGDITLEDKLGAESYSYLGDMYWEQEPHKCNYPTTECIGWWYTRVPPGIIRGTYKTYSQQSADILPLDYDNDGTDTFINFYRVKSARSGYSDRIIGAGNGGYDPLFICSLRANASGSYAGYTYTNAVFYEYKMCFYVDGTLTKTTICTEIYADVKNTYNSSGVLTSTENNYHSGQVAGSMSCFVHETYIEYSYNIYTYDSGTSTYLFSSRQLGIIDRETSTHTTFTVDDDMLGDLYKDSFDKEEPAAIGFHRKTG